MTHRKDKDSSKTQVSVRNVTLEIQSLVWVLPGIVHRQGMVGGKKILFVFEVVMFFFNFCKYEKLNVTDKDKECFIDIMHLWKL